MSTSSDPHSRNARSRHLLLKALTCVLLLILVSLVYPQVKLLTFQTPLPPPKPINYFIVSANGGARESSAVKVIFPSWFTDQVGADVRLDIMYIPMFIKDQQLIPGTQFALGVWPLMDLLKPIEIRVTLDAPRVAQAAEGRVAIMVYDYDTDRWEELPSEFHAGTSQIRAFTQSLKPIPAEYPAGWGERTLFGVFERLPIPTPTLTRTATQVPTSEPTQVPPPTQTSTPEPTQTPTQTPTPTQTSTPEPTQTATQTPTPTQTATQALAQVPTQTPSPTPIDTPYPTPVSGPSLPLPLVLLAIIGALLIIIVVLIVLLTRHRGGE